MMVRMRPEPHSLSLEPLMVIGPPSKSLGSAGSCTRKQQSTLAANHAVAREYCNQPGKELAKSLAEMMVKHHSLSQAIATLRGDLEGLAR
jgi:hypothetical protein